MINWDEEGAYSFELLDSLELLERRMHRDRGLRFIYDSLANTVIEGYVIKSMRHAQYPLVSFSEYDSDMQHKFGITGHLIGSIVGTEVVKSKLLPDTTFAVIRPEAARIFNIPGPAQPVFFHPRCRR